MPPKIIFSGKARPSGLEFGACDECNNGTSGADIVVAFLARLSQDDRPAMLAEAAQLRGKMIQIAPGVFEEFRDPAKAQKVWQRTQGGILKSVATVNMDGPLTKAYLTIFSAKLGMALYREHVGIALPLDGGVQIQFFLNAGLARATAEAMLKVLPGHKTLQQGKFQVHDQFAYRYNCDERSIVAALIGFNSNLHIFVVATSEPEKYGFPIQRPHFYFAKPGQLKSLLPMGRLVT